MDSEALDAAENCEFLDENDIIDVDSMDLEDNDRWYVFICVFTMYQLNICLV